MRFMGYAYTPVKYSYRVFHIAVCSFAGGGGNWEDEGYGFVWSRRKKIDGKNSEESRAHLLSTSTLQLSVSPLPAIIYALINAISELKLFCCMNAWFRASEGEFLPFLSISKGKKLLARLLPFLKNDLALNILHIVASNLPTLMSRDTEEVGQN